MDKKRNWAGFLLVLLLGLLVIPAFAQDGDSEDAPVAEETPVLREVSDDEVNDVAEDLYCPVCESTPLDVCATKACADWRELIRTKLAQGETKQDVFDYFALQYGDSVLAEPPRRGINLILWGLPFVAVALGLVFFARYLKGLRSEEAMTAGAQDVGVDTAVPPPPPADPTQDDYAARIEQELNDR
jgi:cytochrome c-type biogenesis protein CcmH